MSSLVVLQHLVLVGSNIFSDYCMGKRYWKETVVCVCVCVCVHVCVSVSE